MQSDLAQSHRALARVRSLAAVSLAALLAGACSLGGDIGKLGGGIGSSTRLASADAGKSGGGVAAPGDLTKAIEYWGEEHKKKPHDLKAALAFARNLKAAGRKPEAFTVLQSAALLHGDSRELASEYGRLALDLGQIHVAQNLLAMADDPAKPDWRVASARGTVFAKQGKYADAIPFYERALQLSPGQPSVLNNIALAYAADGQAVKAEDYMRQATAKGANPKLAQNFALVLGLRGKHSEAEKVAGDYVPAEVASANSSYMRRLVKHAPSGGDAGPAAPMKPADRTTGVMHAKATTPGMRPTEGTNAVGAPAGSWSTVVNVARR